MSETAIAVRTQSRWKLSLDSWAVLVALLAALLIRAGVFKHIPW
ncbi:MAG TPA: hypothetical protein VEI73_05925 [Candidatus Acidoferrum sp.]|nr:hypothetical protein [Candidatus Acidoferrum sp.]